MPSHAIQLLEFDKVREMLSYYAVTEGGKHAARELEPCREVAAVRGMLRETAEMARALAKAFTLPIEPLEDTVPLAQRARTAASALEPQVFCRIAECLETAHRLATSLCNAGGDYPALVHLGHTMPECPELAARIREVVDANGQVRDDASQELKSIRRRIQGHRRHIESVLRKMVDSPDVRQHLRYPNPTMCRDRYVLPVNAYQKNEVRGLVHGASDSGQTLYIEPMAIVDAGNDLNAAEAEEEEEVRRVLWELTGDVAARAEDIIDCAQKVAEVDLLRAKGLMGNAFGMCTPKVSTTTRLVLRRARHPLLLYMTRPDNVRAPRHEQMNPGRVVPLDVHLGDDFQMLLITGPNTGGKTVSLKTVGLLSLMMQAGMNVPADNAVLPVYDAVYADIGDEQSLEQCLSTFSSHMSRIIRILDSATSNSLVLLDELGAGTDPSEGAALGEAILGRLIEIGCDSVVVTHLGKLKVFAMGRPGVETASMEFDLSSLRPTYKMMMGTVGSSMALEIAERLGLPADILSGARGLLDDESQGEYGTVLDQIKLAREDAEERRDRMEYLEGEAARLKAEYEAALARLKAEEERKGADLGLKIYSQIEDLLQDAERLHEDLRYSHKQVARRVKKLRNSLRQCLSDLDALLEGHTPDRELKEGDEVYVIKLHKWGTVSRVDRRNERLRVDVGGMQVDVANDDIQPWGEKK